MKDVPRRTVSAKKRIKNMDFDNNYNMECFLKKIHEPGSRGLNRGVWEVLQCDKIIGHIEIDFCDYEPWRPLVIRAIRSTGKHTLCKDFKEAKTVFNATKIITEGVN
jgi:hypothetical protein